MQLLHFGIQESGENNYEICSSAERKSLCVCGGCFGGGGRSKTGMHTQRIVVFTFVGQI